MHRLIKIVPVILLLVLVFSPLTIFAQSGGSTLGCSLPTSNKTVGDLFAHVTCLIYKTIIPMFFALAMAMFLWGVVQYVVNEGDEGKREKGKQFMVWGIIGLTVMVTVWALVAVLGSTFGFDTKTIPSLPSN